MGVVVCAEWAEVGPPCCVVGMVGNVVKWMDIETKVRFRSNDYTFINYAPSIPWQEYVGQEISM
eukprot:COSAG05_NODE_14892_length_384_cov_0.624561_1_plen_63_part_01